MIRHNVALVLTILCLIPVYAQAIQLDKESDKTSNKMQVDIQHIKSWNKFTDYLYQIHQQQLKEHKVYSTSVIGGYPTNKDYYVEKRYYDKESNKLLSIIQWEKDNKIHTIEIYKYDNQGRVTRDYLSAYLPTFRNAPIQTLINIHSYNDELHSYRQFDASGYLIYEQCEGNLFNQKILLSIDEDEFNSDIIESEEYLACFNQSKSTVGKFINPLVESPELMMKSDFSNSKNLNVYENLREKIKQYTLNINNNSNTANNYLLRGNVFFKIQKFSEAIDDYDQAIKLANLDKAYFGRGMAKGRFGLIESAIEDLTVYINRNPLDSVGYTKRGVRHLWLGNLKNAEKDLIKAINLDSKNAEAHDDLGVIYANRGDHKTAKTHFTLTIKIDRSYQKAYHNLAMVNFITGEHQDALQKIDLAIELSPNSKNSLLLKSEILLSMGRENEASEIKNIAEFLPEGNWSERLSIKNE